MAKKLVIVESPTKAKTISRFLGNEFVVTSSMGHVRDLPKRELGVDVAHGFAPRYVVPKKNQPVVTSLKKTADKSEAVYFATDEDREGEAISWHLADLLKIEPAKVKRITFDEITKEAVLNAVQNPRAIDQHLVDAQQARRVLDRLVGYELSPFLWKKVVKGLSAGRVQSVAVRLIVEREREILAFKAQEFWTIDAEFKNSAGTVFPAKLSKLGDKALDKFGIPNEADAKKIHAALKSAGFAVANVEAKTVQKNPSPPFTTSTLQQAANRQLGFSARRTMYLAQSLYEGVDIGSEGSVGLITYMRTDSVNLSQKFLGEAQAYVKSAFGERYATGPRAFQTKSKLAQEAHEAIRPSAVERTPESIKAHLDANQYKLYDLIWRRAVASQLPPAEINATGVDIITPDKAFTFRATGSSIAFDGYLKVYPESINESILPKLTAGEAVTAQIITPNQHFTVPPARFSEAGLVKTLEAYGIGRPSTYAPTIATVIDRGYVIKEERRLKPTELAMLVNDVLVEHFPVIVDYQFTAQMEAELDAIASGEKEWSPVIGEFYSPFKENLEKKHIEVSKKDLTEQTTDEVCDKCGKPMIIKLGRFGKFLACTGYPDCKNTKPLNSDGTKAEPEPTDEVCDKCGKPMVRKHGRYGPFLGCSGYPECKGIKRIDNKTGVSCPECQQGELVERRSKFGRSFYSCNRYPDCKFALWSKPTGEKCPDCGSLIVLAKEGKTRCSKKDCDWESEAKSD